MVSLPGPVMTAGGVCHSVTPSNEQILAASRKTWKLGM